MRVCAVACVFLLASACVGSAVADSKASKPKSNKGELLALVDPLEASSAQCSSAPTSLIARAFSGDALGVAPLASAGLLADDYACSAKCNREPFDSNSTESSCWGTFTWFCKSTNSSCHTVVGVKCEGHYSLYTDKDAGKALAVCEGLHKYFNVRTATCPATGARATKYIAAGCFGTGLSGMSDVSSARGAAAAVVADMAAYANGATAAPFASGNAGVVLAGQDDSQQSAGHHDLMSAQGVGRVESGRGFSYEGKCGGLGWEVKGVSTSAAESADLPVYSDVEELEADVEASLAALGLPPKLISVGTVPATAAAKDKKEKDDGKTAADPAAVTKSSKPPSLEPPDNSLLKALLPAVAAKVDLGDGRHITCNLTCNGEEPWLDGALPCWGKLLLRCEGRPNEKEDFVHKLTKLEAKEAEAAARQAKWVKDKNKKAAAAAKKKKDELRKKELKKTGKVASDLPLSRTAYAAVHGRRAMVTRRERRALLAAVQRYTFAAGMERTEMSSPGVSFEFDATCKGFWTGWFGKRCYGLTQTHGAFVSNVKDVEMWGLCTGKHGVSAKKGKEGYAMGAWCKGHSAKGVVVEMHDQSDGPHVTDLHLDMQEVTPLLPADGAATAAAAAVEEKVMTAAAGADGSAAADLAEAVEGGMAAAATQAAVATDTAGGAGDGAAAATVVAEGGVVRGAGEEPQAEGQGSATAAGQESAEGVDGPRL